MFIVVPYLSSDQTTYGIYTVCISITIFLSYADLGFLSAAQKYAAESYSQGDREREVSLIGFAHFIFLCVTLLIGGVFLYFSFHPDQLINNLLPGRQTQTAHELLLILAFSTPIVVIQRLVQMIFGIRLEEYHIQKLVIAGNALKILSVFYFFTNGRYNIVGYYLFIQIIAAFVAVGGIWMARYKYQYPLGQLVRRFRFSNDIFRHTRSLAFSSLFITLCWILYYELDSIAIAKLLGADAVAIYAIGLSILSFSRSLVGVLFSPFSSRFNHFIGLGQWSEFRHFYLHVIFLTFPLVVFPFVAVAMMSRGVVISWVGPEYAASVEIVVWLVLCNILGFVSYPTGIMLMACEKIRQLYLQNALMVLIFWGGIFTTVGIWGIESFARFKFLTFIFNGIAYLWLSLQFLGISLRSFLRTVVVPYLPGLAVMLGVLFLIRDSYITGKDKLNLALNGVLILGSIFVGLMVSLWTVPRLRQYVFQLLRLPSKHGL
ncbi:hypothetical protein [uncultured Rikenella sp.]|nr:hypothetical protein [uncultured Rikenella sp.]